MPGMSKEFLDWILANGLCGGYTCAEGRKHCDSTQCHMVVMWPNIQIHDDEAGKRWLAITCYTVQAEFFGELQYEMYGVPLKVDMPEIVRKSYFTKHAIYQKLEKLRTQRYDLNDRIYELEKELAA